MDQCICAAPHSFSQLITSFIASESLGIPHAPLIRLRDFFFFSSTSQYVNELVAKSLFGNAGNISNRLLMPPSSMMEESRSIRLQKGGVPAAPSGTATLLRLSPSRRFYPNGVFNLPLQVSPTPMA